MNLPKVLLGRLFQSAYGNVLKVFIKCPATVHPPQWVCSSWQKITSVWDWCCWKLFKEL